MFDLDLGVLLRDGVLEMDSDLALLLSAVDVNSVAEVEATEQMISSSLGMVGRLKEPPSSWTNNKINCIHENKLYTYQAQITMSMTSHQH